VYGVIPKPTGRTSRSWVIVVGVPLAFGLLFAGCDLWPSPDPCSLNPAACPPQYVGAAACQSCHSSFSADYVTHGHSQALKIVQGVVPSYTASSLPVGVPAPPSGFAWTDIGLVIGGYTKAANFVSTQGYVLTDGQGGPALQYNLQRPPTATVGDFVARTAGQAGTTPYAYECFRCHTTGAESTAQNGGLRQDNRPGIGGTWALAGVQCEACHGPGSHHVPNPLAGNINVTGTPEMCAQCHADLNSPTTIAASGGFVSSNYQSAEVLASPHSGFYCSFCHDPHRSVIHDRDNAIRNRCQVCHTDRNMAMHSGKIFVRGDYVEYLDCTSCHMPPAAKTATSLLIDLGNGENGRIGDTRTHIMYVNTQKRDYTAMFTVNGQEVARDAQGKAAVTVDFVCLRCHSGSGSAFPLTISGAATIADGIHSTP